MKEAAEVYQEVEAPTNLPRVCAQLRLLASELELTGIEPSSDVQRMTSTLASAVGRMRRRHPNIDALIRAIAEALHTTPDALRSHRREQHASFVRQQAMYLIRELTLLSFPRIGQFFDKDHSTILHGHNLIAKRMERDQIFAHSMRKLTERVKAAIR